MNLKEQVQASSEVSGTFRPETSLRFETDIGRYSASEGASSILCGRHFQQRDEHDAQGTASGSGATWHTGTDSPPLHGARVVAVHWKPILHLFVWISISTSVLSQTEEGLACTHRRPVAR